MTQNPPSGGSRRCVDCKQPIDKLPKHFRFCRLCFSRQPESTPREDDGLRDEWLEYRDLERLLTGID